MLLNWYETVVDKIHVQLSEPNTRSNLSLYRVRATDNKQVTCVFNLSQNTKAHSVNRVCKVCKSNSKLIDNLLNDLI